MAVLKMADKNIIPDVIRNVDTDEDMFPPKRRKPATCQVDDRFIVELNHQLLAVLEELRQLKESVDRLFGGHDKTMMPK